MELAMAIEMITRIRIFPLKGLKNAPVVNQSPLKQRWSFRAGMIKLHAMLHLKCTYQLLQLVYHLEAPPDNIS